MNSLLWHGRHAHGLVALIARSVVWHVISRLVWAVPIGVAIAAGVIAVIALRRRPARQPRNRRIRR